MSIDKMLAALDAGLQSSEEHGYPERVDDPSKCARCLTHEPVPDADLCSPCRQFLLGDSNEDPTRQGVTIGADGSVRGYLTLRENTEHREICCNCRSCNEAFADGMADVESRVLERYYVTMHLNGDARDNRPENLEIMPARENVRAASGPAAQSHDWQAEAWRHHQQIRAEALERVAIGLDIPRELLGDVRANQPYDWATERLSSDVAEAWDRYVSRGRRR